MISTHKERWGQEVFNEPELDRAVGIPEHAQNHDRGESLTAIQHKNDTRTSPKPTS